MIVPKFRNDDLHLQRPPSDRILTDCIVTPSLQSPGLNAFAHLVCLLQKQRQRLLVCPLA